MKAVVVAVILPLILAEVSLIGPWLAERLLRRGTCWLPYEYQERYLADWVGELDAVPGSLFKLGFAIRVLLSVPATQRALTGREALWVLALKRMLALGITGLLMALMAVNRLGKQTRDPARADAFTAQMAQALRRKDPESASPTPERPIWTGDVEQMPPAAGTRFDEQWDWNLAVERVNYTIELKPGDKFHEVIEKAIKEGVLPRRQRGPLDDSQPGALEL